MKLLEARVRNALLEKHVDKSIEFFSSNPELVNSVKNLFEKSNLPKDYKEFLSKNYFSKFNDHEALKDHYKNQLDYFYMSEEQLRNAIKYSDESEDSGSHPSPFLNALFPIVKFTDVIVRELVKIAESEGVNSAVDKEEKIIKKIFPRKEFFRDLYSNFYNTLLKANLLESCSNIEFPGTPDCSIELKKIFDEALKVADNFDNKILESRIREIYEEN